jgi:hypothetical protein
MKQIIYVAITFSVIFLSCEKDSASGTGPRKPITRADLYRENGYISGTIEGTNSSGTAFTKAFTHQLDGEMATYYVSAKGQYIVHLNKLDKYGRVGDDDKKTDMTLILNNGNSVKSITDFHTSIYIDSSATAITKFNISSNPITLDGPGSFGNVVFSNVAFNITDGTFACDYIINVLNTTTSSSSPAKITGQINTKLINLRYRTGS